MAMNVSTKLLEAAGDQQYKVRKTAIVTAWRQWLHATITAMEQQRTREKLSEDMLISDELGALIAEFEHCNAVGDVLLGRVGDDDGETK
jgi:hypothetical protein